LNYAVRCASGADSRQIFLNAGNISNAEAIDVGQLSDI